MFENAVCPKKSGWCSLVLDTHFLFSLQTVQARRNTNLKEKREAIELTKMGRMSQQELDNWKPKTKSLTYGEKKERSQKRKIGKAVKFARSDRNKNKACLLYTSDAVDE